MADNVHGTTDGKTPLLQEVRPMREISTNLPPGLCDWCEKMKLNVYGLCPYCFRFPKLTASTEDAAPTEGLSNLPPNKMTARAGVAVGTIAMPTPFGPSTPSPEASSGPSNCAECQQEIWPVAWQDKTGYGFHYCGGEVNRWEPHEPRQLERLSPNGDVAPECEHQYNGHFCCWCMKPKPPTPSPEVARMDTQELPWDKMAEIAADDFCDTDCEIQKGCPACIAIKGTRWALQMRDQLRAARATIERLQEEKLIVSRIWSLLGNPTYTELNGRSIYDLIEDYMERAEKAEAELERLSPKEGA